MWWTSEPPRAPLVGRTIRRGDAQLVERRLFGRRSVDHAISTTSFGWSGTFTRHRRRPGTLLGPEGSVILTPPADRRAPELPDHPASGACRRDRPHVENYTVDASIFVATSY